MTSEELNFQVNVGMNFFFALAQRRGIELDDRIKEEYRQVLEGQVMKEAEESGGELPLFLILTG